MQTSSKIILGIDPGTIMMGYGVIAVHGSKLQLLHMDVLKLGVKDDAYLKLKKIHEKVIELILTYKPDDFAIEAPFFGKNVQSMLKLGRAQGVAIAAAMHTSIPVCEYSPRKIKQSITGNGNAGKEQVVKMLQQILQFTDTPKYLDATDALAVAVCHHFQQGIPGNGVKSTSKLSAKGWGTFIKDNPGRVK